MKNKILILILLFALITLSSCYFSSQKQPENLEEEHILLDAEDYLSFTKKIKENNLNYCISYNNEKMSKYNDHILIYEKNDYKYYENNNVSYLIIDEIVFDIDDSQVEKYIVFQCETLELMLSDLLSSSISFKIENKNLLIKTRYGYFEIIDLTQEIVSLKSCETQQIAEILILFDEPMNKPLVTKNDEKTNFLTTICKEEVLYRNEEFDIFEYNLNETNETKIDLLFDSYGEKKMHHLESNFNKENAVFSKSVYTGDVGKTVYNSNNIESDKEDLFISKKRLIEIETEILNRDKYFELNGNLVNVLTINENLWLYNKEEYRFSDETNNYKIIYLTIGIMEDFQYSYSWSNGINKSKSTPIELSIVGYVEIENRNTNEITTLAIRGQSIESNISNVTSTELKKSVITFNSQILIVG